MNNSFPTSPFSERPTLPPGDPVGPGVLPDVPGYELIAELGRGGMGVVYRARQAGLNRVVALKMILTGAHAAGEDLERFRTEAQAIARLQHPHIIAVYEIGEHSGLPYFSLELCDGGSLDRKLAGRPLPPREAASLVVKLAHAVHVAHTAHVVHRDLKPANVLLLADGTPKITDFGLAKRLDADSGQTKTGSIMGTPSYMAPEQAEGRKTIGPSADVYALGAILYECLTGRPPFKAATPLDTVMQVLHDDPVPPRQYNPAVPRDLEAVCLKCLEKAPGRRYGSAQDLAEDLQRFLDGEAVSVQSGGFLGQIAGAMDRVQLQEKFASYGALLLWLAPVMLLPEVLITAAIWNNWPAGVLAVTQFARIVAFVLLVGAYRGWRWMPQGPAERHLWAVWCGYLVTCMASGFSVRIANGFLSTSPEKFIYPYFALLAGLAFFALAGTFWGYCAVIGLLWAAVSCLMAVEPLYAPLQYGITWFAILILLGLRLRRLGAASRP